MNEHDEARINRIKEKLVKHEFTNYDRDDVHFLLKVITGEWQPLLSQGKEKSNWPLEYARKFTNWEFFLVAKDAYYAGFKKYEEELEALMKGRQSATIEQLRTIGCKVIEHDIKDGNHQLTGKTLGVE